AVDRVVPELAVDQVVAVDRRVELVEPEQVVGRPRALDRVVTLSAVNGRRKVHRLCAVRDVVQIDEVVSAHSLNLDPIQQERGDHRLRYPADGDLNLDRLERGDVVEDADVALVLEDEDVLAQLAVERVRRPDDVQDVPCTDEDLEIPGRVGPIF